MKRNAYRMKTKVIDLKVTVDYPRRWRVGKVITKLREAITEDTAISITEIGKIKPNEILKLTDETNS